MPPHPPPLPPDLLLLSGSVSYSLLTGASFPPHVLFVSIHLVPFLLLPLLPLNPPSPFNPLFIYWWVFVTKIVFMKDRVSVCKCTEILVLNWSSLLFVLKDLSLCLVKNSQRQTGKGRGGLRFREPRTYTILYLTSIFRLKRESTINVILFCRFSFVIICQQS